MSTRLRAGLLLLGSSALLAAASARVAPDAAKVRTIRYDRDVRPILADRCFTCHVADAGARAAKLRLDNADDASADRGGSEAIMPGRPATRVSTRRSTSIGRVGGMQTEMGR